MTAVANVLYIFVLPLDLAFRGGLHRTRATEGAGASAAGAPASEAGA